jgi:hypothetical protein
MLVYQRVGQPEFPLAIFPEAASIVLRFPGTGSLRFGKPGSVQALPQPVQSGRESLCQA